VQIGQTVYETRAWPYGDKRVPCPVCYGKLCAVLELGNGERVTVECEACGLGLDGPRGFINEPCAGSVVRAFVVAGFVQDGEEWRVLEQSNRGNYRWGVEAFGTEAEAEARRAVLYAEVVEDAAYRSLRKDEYLRKKPTWLVRYHRDAIRQAERDLAWHTRKLSDAVARTRSKT
jgi:hypothetical protein